jgi:farnesyl-diphosphate farnesyltransferase
MMQNHNQNNQAEAMAFSREILPQVSRTFDLAIKFLPKKLGQPVGLAYLLCRIADTFEDSVQLDPNTRQDKLGKYALLLERTDRFDETLITDIQYSFAQDHDKAVKGDSGDHAASIELVRNIDKVLLAVESMPEDFKKHIFPWVREMSLGMASYTTLANSESDNIRFLKDEEDWDKYCYYVAGTVGHMLTDIFSSYAGFGEDTREKLHKLGCSFGLGLQKVNILKDAIVDTSRGICFLPQTFIDKYGISFDNKSQKMPAGDMAGMVRQIVEVCRLHFTDALEYIKVIPIKYLGLRMFLIVPVMLAAATLRLFTQYPQRLLESGDLKLARNEVWKLVRRSALCKYSNRLLLSSFNQIYPA